MEYPRGKDGQEKNCEDCKTRSTRNTPTVRETIEMLERLFVIFELKIKISNNSNSSHLVETRIFATDKSKVYGKFSNKCLFSPNITVFLQNFFFPNK